MLGYAHHPPVYAFYHRQDITPFYLPPPCKLHAYDFLLHSSFVVVFPREQTPFMVFVSNTLFNHRFLNPLTFFKHWFLNLLPPAGRGGGVEFAGCRPAEW